MATDRLSILFLDIDGVLISGRCWHPPLRTGDKRAPVDPDCVNALNRILKETGALIVISSTWRADGLMRCRDYLNAWGVTPGKVLGVTPRLEEEVGGKPRGLEIQHWLDNTRHDVSAFVILDDDSDMEHLAPRLIRTEFDIGLTEQDAERAIAMLRELSSDSPPRGYPTDDARSSDCPNRKQNMRAES